jgi:hypothetical protein
MLKEHNVDFSYTVEASSFGYGKKDFILFDREEYKKIGGSIGKGMSNFLRLLLLIPRRL